MSSNERDLYHLPINYPSIQTSTTSITSIQTANAEAIGAACNEACQAAMLHIKDEFCGLGKGLSATSAFLFICVILQQQK